MYEGRHPAYVGSAHEEDRDVCRVAERPHRAEHAAEVPQHLEPVMWNVSDVSLFDAEHLGHQGDLTVSVTLIGLSDHLVHKPLDVGGSLPEFWSVVYNDGHCCCSC